MDAGTTVGDATVSLTGLTDNLELQDFANVISAVLPLVAIAVLVGMLFYTIRWAIGLFRGV